MRILVVTQQRETGLTYHRQTVPHRHLTANYEKYKVDYAYDISGATKEELSNYQIVTFLRVVDADYKSKEILDKCKEAGCKTVIDIDDYWNLNKTHELYHTYEKNNISKQTVDGLVNCDWVTTTTEHFADKIREFNKNVTVLPNSIDPLQPQFMPNKKESDKVRFGYIAGVFHAPDARLMFEGMRDVYKTINRNKFQFCLGGYNPNMSYNFIEMMFTNEFKSISKTYKEYLVKYVQEGNEIADLEPYKRLWGLDVYNYARLYNEVDVSLVPLVSNSFNSYKSQIKIIEAGHFKKAAIVSNVAPYTFDCNKENSILINPDKKNLGWGVAIKSLIQNPNRIEDLGEALHETVKDKYNINTVNKVRNELYQKLCE